jgi:hypothetical protein
MHVVILPLFFGKLVRLESVKASVCPTIVEGWCYCDCVCVKINFVCRELRRKVLGINLGCALDL